MSKHKIPCIRCLLRDLDQKAALKQVTAYRERLPVQQRANKELFEERLSICPLGTKIW